MMSLMDDDASLFHFLASSSPSCVETLRSASRSTLLPMSAIGTFSPDCAFPCSIWSLNDCISANDSCSVMLYTKTKPLPSPMYSPRSEAYSSCPAVSRMSRVHGLPSTSVVLRYESSMVGSYLLGHLLAQNCRVMPDFP